jgi:hypothetical protein
LEIRPSKAPEEPGGLKLAGYCSSRRASALRIAAIAVVSVVVLLAAAGVSAQLPLTSLKSSGQTVSPVYEGWYKNADGTFTMSFGYYNRNTVEVVGIPVGADNFISPGDRNQGQPTEFQPRRHWGVFGVKVPADFGKKEVLWTLKFRGATYAIPGMLHPNWQIDALEGEAGSGNTPPVVKFSETGAEGRGPVGVTAGPMTASTGQPLPISVWASDDGKSPAARGRGAAPQVQLAWFKHQGPGAVTFKPATGRAAAAGEQVTTQATFAAAGDYIVRVRANDSSGVAGAGHAQCCWTNGFVKVTVK